MLFRVQLLRVQCSWCGFRRYSLVWGNWTDRTRPFFSCFRFYNFFLQFFCGIFLQFLCRKKKNFLGEVWKSLKLLPKWDINPRRQARREKIWCWSFVFSTIPYSGDDFWDYLNQMYDKFCRKSMIFCTQTPLFFSTQNL